METYATIDLGNTFGKMGLFQNGKLIDFRKGLRVKTVLKELKKVKPNHTIISSVTKDRSELNNIFSEIDNLIILSPETPIPIKNGYKTPNTLGHDRLAAAVGAKSYYPDSSVLIIDMGTAIKYDFIDSKAVFKGGIIGPGLQMRFKALHTFTKKLPLIEADGIPKLIGDSTSTCIQSGVINGLAAEMNGIIARYKSKEPVQIIITGGDAPFFESQINYPTFAAPNLVLEGLNRILEYNVEKTKLIR